MTKLEIKNLGYSIDGQEIVKNICIDIAQGDFVGIIGPNGSGKSTLLKNIYRVYKPTKGTILLDGNDIKKNSYREMAEKMSVLSQENDVAFEFSVYEMVELGINAVSSKNKNNEKIILSYLAKVGMDKFAQRSYQSLSGGEKQRVLISRALAQQSELFILDEPTNHLDIGCQFKIMNLIKEQNLTVFSAIHDLNMGVHFCDVIMVMYDGKIIKVGVPSEVITSKLIKDVFDANTYIETNQITGKQNIVYVP